MANYSIKSVGLSGRVHLQTDPRPLNNDAHRQYVVEGSSILPSRPDGIDDHLGKLVAINDRHAAVTVTGYNEVILYRRSNGSWYYETTLVAPQTDEQFGYSVALAGNRLAVGAPNANNGQGRVYSYEYKEGWRSVMDGILIPDNANIEPDCRFGESLSFVGSTLAVGAPNAIGGGLGGVRLGSVYLFTYWVYRRYWQSLGHVSPSNGQDNSHFAKNVFLADENTLVVGAARETVTNIAEAGAVYMWARNYNSGTATTTWRFVTKFNSPLPAAGAHYGTSVNLKGKRLLIGEPDNAQGGTVYLYTGYGDVWTYRQTLEARNGGGLINDSLAGSTDRLGLAVDQEVALNTILIGAPGYNGGRGVVWAFELTEAGNWIPATTYRLTDDNMFENSSMGYSIASDENDLWIGAPDADTNRGRVLIYRGSNV